MHLGYHYQALDVYVEEEGGPVVGAVDAQRSVYRRALAAGIAGSEHSLAMDRVVLMLFVDRIAAGLSRGGLEDSETSVHRSDARSPFHPSFLDRLPGITCSIPK